MTYRGRIKNGMVVLDGEQQLAEGMEVEIRPIEDDQLPTLAEQFANVIGQAKDLPEDFAENHDHYIHGTSKRRTS